MTNTQRPNCAILFVGHRLERALPGDPAGKLEIVDGHPDGGKDPSPRRYLRGVRAACIRESPVVTGKPLCSPSPIGRLLRGGSSKLTEVNMVSSGAGIISIVFRTSRAKRILLKF